MSTFNDSPYHNETSMDERREALKNDTTKGGGPSNDTYLSRAARSLGAELGGRFAHLGKEQSVVGQRGPHVWPRQPTGSPWRGDEVPDEPPLGINVNALPESN